MDGLVLGVAGFVFRFVSDEPLWQAGPGSLLADFQADGSPPDFVLHLLAWEKPGEPGLSGPRIQTETLECRFTEGYERGEVRFLTSPEEFRQHPESLLDLLMRIVLVSTGRAYPLHACGVVDGERGLLFTGPSDAGKTTMAGLWRERAGVTVLGDERIWLRRVVGGGYTIHGALLPSKIGTVSPAGAPLDRIFFIRHAAQNVVAPARGVETLTALLAQAHLGLFGAVDRALPVGFYADLVQALPCYDLGFVPDRRIVDFVRQVP